MGAGRRSATIEDVPAEEMEKATAMHKALVEAAAEHDETLMEKFFEQDSLTEDEMREGIRKGLGFSRYVPRILRGVRERTWVCAV